MPAMPHLYQADIQLLDGDRVVARASRPFGLRPLGALGRKLLFDGKRWVLRGIFADEVAERGLDAWRLAGATLLARNPGNHLCAEASRLGVLIVAELDASETSEIRRLAHWPAVGLIVLPKSFAAGADHGARNVLLAERFAAHEPIRPQEWAQVAFCELGEAPDLADRIDGANAPIVALRPSGPLSTVAQGRALCDQLQGELAGRRNRSGALDLSGYIV